MPRAVQTLLPAVEFQSSERSVVVVVVTTTMALLWLRAVFRIFVSSLPDIWYLRLKLLASLRRTRRTGMDAAMIVTADSAAPHTVRGVETSV